MNDASPYSYEGSELGTFAHATVWKAYLRSHIGPFVSGEVLEVGAGLGSSTAAFVNGRVTRWICLEPDPHSADSLLRRLKTGSLPAVCQVERGTVQDIHDRFDCVLYVDVLEHIEDDHAELGLAAERIRKGGHLVVLSPAHQWLFTPFDRAVGHHRRYTRKTLGELRPPGLRLIRSLYLDSVGLLASLGNRVVLRSSDPSRSQVEFWDKVLVRLSKRTDRLLGHRVGKSVLAVWRKE